MKPTITIEIPASSEALVRHLVSQCSQAIFGEGDGGREGGVRTRASSD